MQRKAQLEDAIANCEKSLAAAKAEQERVAEQIAATHRVDSVAATASYADLLESRLLADERADACSQQLEALSRANSVNRISSQGAGLRQQPSQSRPVWTEIRSRLRDLFQTR